MSRFFGIFALKGTPLAIGAAACAILLIGAARPAAANGRFPLANQFVVDPHDPTHLVARVTFGLLNSSDGGKTWQWICEQAIGYSGVEDPSVAVTGNGTLIAASSRGLSATHDAGCAWSRRTGRFGVDVTIDPTNAGRALALESYLIGSMQSTSLVETIDHGDSWAEVSLLEPALRAETLEVAPSNSDRVYVSGTLSPADMPLQEAVVARSNDRGLTFTTTKLGLPMGDLVFIGAIAPSDPDLLYVRVLSGSGADAFGRVLVSRDGAATWQEVWTGPGDPAGFALSADGTKIAVGGPLAGIHIASTTDFLFRKVSDIGVKCLTWSAAGLFACTQEALSGFSIGLSTDEGTTFAPVLHFPEILPGSCPEGSAGEGCLGFWGALAPTIGIDAGIADASVGGGGQVGEATAPSGGCGCEFARGRSASSVVGWLLSVAWIGFGFARHRRVRFESRY